MSRRRKQTNALGENGLVIWCDAELKVLEHVTSLLKENYSQHQPANNANAQTGHLCHLWRKLCLDQATLCQSVEFLDAQTFRKELDMSERKLLLPNVCLLRFNYGKTA